MDTIYFQNGTYSPLNVHIIEAQGGTGKQLRVPPGAYGKFWRLPNVDFAIIAFDSADGSLQHLGKTRPGLQVYVIHPNQTPAIRESTLQERAAAEQFAVSYTA